MVIVLGADEEEEEGEGAGAAGVARGRRVEGTGGSEGVEKGYPGLDQSSKLSDATNTLSDKLLNIDTFSKQLQHFKPV